MFQLTSAYYCILVMRKGSLAATPPPPPPPPPPVIFSDELVWPAERRIWGPRVRIRRLLLHSPRCLAVQRGARHGRPPGPHVPLRVPVPRRHGPPRRSYGRHTGRGRPQASHTIAAVEVAPVTTRSGHQWTQPLPGACSRLRRSLGMSQRRPLRDGQPDPGTPPRLPRECLAQWHG